MKAFLNKYLIPREDKLKHFYLWTIMYFILKYICLYFDLDKMIAVYITVGSAIFKEVVWDWLLGKGTPELKDALSGSAVAILDLITDES